MDPDDDGFVRNYYQHLSAEDLASYEVDTLTQRIHRHRELAATRERGEALVLADSEPDATVLYVVTDDTPFLVDSVVAEVARHHAAIRQVSHPTFIVTRDRSTGRLRGVERVPSHSGVSSGDTAAMPHVSARVADVESGETVSTVESWIAVEAARMESSDARDALVAGVRRVLGDVRAVVEDFTSMRDRLIDAAEGLEALTDPTITARTSGAQLLRWLADDNFTLIGYREHDLVDRDGEEVLVNRPGTALGVLRHAEHVQHQLTSAGRRKAREKTALVITKANSRSTVHRPAWLDYIGVKDFNAAGEVIGEKLFLGVLAADAFIGSVQDIPLVRDKVQAVLRHCGFPPDSHSGKDLKNILETYPREEMFQISTDELIETVTAILHLQERRRTRLFLRTDVWGRFVSVLVYLPRDRYTTSVRHRIENELTAAFGAESIDFEARMSESVLARLYFRIRLPQGVEAREVNVDELEKRVQRAGRSWSEGIEQVLRTRADLSEVSRLAGQWAEAFPAAYRADFEVEDALEDIRRFEQAEAGGHPELALRRPDAASADEDSPAAAADARLKIYLRQPRSLTALLPVFHNLGLQVLDERPFRIERADGAIFHLYDLGLQYPAGIDPMAGADDLADAFRAALAGAMETDRFDRLILAEGLHWRQVQVLRAYGKYLRQLGNTSSYGFMADTLLANPDVARALVAVFEAAFDPQYGAADDPDRTARRDDARAALDAALDAVATLDADRLLRAFAEVIDATLRTTFYQGSTHLAFKLATRRIESAPVPRPEFEIWVYSPEVEGVHLRFGAVARGGLRWSDRQEDFRTEILGLVKAQTVKNAVIVPTGAKGGFYPKRLPDPATDRAAWLEAGQDAYRTFIRALLDLTDNRVTDAGGTARVVGPDDVVRHDGDDPYLVVAADKGTAAFSDTANAISADYGFWLGDAFASGGSVGYDHKAMGITARGAWESVKAHFKELGLDTQADDFTVVGVGDMSGDVFGNGMLLSEHIRLVAAFDHRHVFLDPDPDPTASYAERRRLFDLPRSSWADYDTDLISEGGGVYPRSAKSIPISAQVRAALGLPEDTARLSPPELLRAVLAAPVDLLYNGGIGTYIKASTETNASVGDKANDGIRIDGADVRARVIGEGGNLGMTQRGRIEAALTGVVLNTDAIDNSAGVDCSDHEVNIKILVDSAVRAGRLDAGERAAFLHAMTDEVADLVLADNVDQNLLLLNDKQHGPEWAPSFERHMDWLQEHADLDRALEFLPTTEQVQERIADGRGLTSPELSVLAAYAKIQLTGALLRGDVPDDPWFEDVLLAYFPTPVRERFPDEVLAHPLRREIIATAIANDMVNIGGITFAFRAMEETGVDESSIARAFTALRRIYALDDVVRMLTEVPAGVPTETWCQIYSDMRRLLDRAVRWFVTHGYADEEIGRSVELFEPVIDPLRSGIGRFLRGADQQRERQWYQRAVDGGVPDGLAARWAGLFESYALLDVAELARQSGQPVELVLHTYFAVYDRFEVDDLLERITRLPRRDRWQALARAALREDLYSTAAELTTTVLETTGDTPDAGGVERLDRWQQDNAERLDRVRSMFTEATTRQTDDMASLSVALRLLRSIVRR
ncbi:glutamate dehydrogenase [Tersicoccus phoenicis]|uniref:Glutamate dehydrogenase n=1 Tax=Tersicoccus phoenicis TaxID=554083 RepID=A0A1R1LHR9_9MICC|nr:glutamate dehydrogenase [Tersicoccus phoenicis]